MHKKLIFFSSMIFSIPYIKCINYALKIINYSTDSNIDYAQLKNIMNGKNHRLSLFGFNDRKFEFCDFQRETFYNLERRLVNSIMPEGTYEMKEAFFEEGLFYFSFEENGRELHLRKNLYIFYFDEIFEGYSIIIFRIIEWNKEIIKCRLLDFRNKIPYSTRFNLKHFKLYNFFPRGKFPMEHLPIQKLDPEKCDNKFTDGIFNMFNWIFWYEPTINKNRKSEKDICDSTNFDLDGQFEEYKILAEIER